MGSGSQTSETTVPQWMQDYSQNTVLPFAQNIADTPFQSYQGDMTVDASPYSAQAAGQYDSMAGIAGMGAGDFAAMNQQNMNPYQQNVIDTSMAGLRNAYAEAGAGLQDQVAGSGAFGNDRRGVMEGQLGADFALGAGQMEAGLRQQGYSNAQAQTLAQLQARMGAAGGAAQGYSQLAGTDMALQSQNQANALQEFMREQSNPYQQLGALTGASAAMPNMSTTTQTKKNGLLDYLTAGAGILGGLG